MNLKEARKLVDTLNDMFEASRELAASLAENFPNLLWRFDPLSERLEVVEWPEVPLVPAESCDVFTAALNAVAIDDVELATDICQALSLSTGWQFRVDPGGSFRYAVPEPAAA